MRLSARARSPSSSGESRVSGWSRFPAAISPAARLISVSGRARLRERRTAVRRPRPRVTREGGDPQRQEGGAAARPHGRGPRLEATQGGLPGRLREGDDAPPGRDPSRGDDEADLGARASPDDAGRRDLAGQVPVEGVAVPRVGGRAVGEDAPLLVDHEERLDRQPGPDLLDVLVEPLDVELVEGVEQVRAQVPRRPPQGRLLVGGASRADRVVDLGLDEPRLAEGDDPGRREGGRDQGEREGRDPGGVAGADAADAHHRGGPQHRGPAAQALPVARGQRLEPGDAGGEGERVAARLVVVEAQERLLGQRAGREGRGRRGRTAVHGRSAGSRERRGAGSGSSPAGPTSRPR